MNEVKIDNTKILESYRNFKYVTAASFVFAFFGLLCAVFVDDVRLSIIFTFMLMSVSLCAAFLGYKGRVNYQSAKSLNVAVGRENNKLILFDKPISSDSIDLAVIVTNTKTMIPFSNYDTQDRKIVDLFIKFKNVDKKDISDVMFSDVEKINEKLWLRVNLSYVMGYENAVENIPVIEEILKNEGIEIYRRNDIKDFFNYASKNMLAVGND